MGGADSLPVQPPPPAAPRSRPTAGDSLELARSALRAARASCAYAHAAEALLHSPREWRACLLAALACQLCGRIDVAYAMGLHAVALAPAELRAGGELASIVQRIHDEYAAPLVRHHRVACNAPPAAPGAPDSTRLSGSVRFVDARTGAELASAAPEPGDLVGVRRVSSPHGVRAGARVRVHMDLHAMFDDLKLLAFTAALHCADGRDAERILAADTRVLEHAEGEHELRLLLPAGSGRTKLRLELNTERAGARAGACLVVHVA